ncbi:MAG TPA: glycogen debranching enzyme GlgX, partial [Rhodocyclaceae bacterium]
YRNTVRAYWLTGNASAGGLAQRLAGSSELFRAGGRQPQSSVAFIAAHDGFTLHDLVSYARRHNEANGEGNRDGQSDNHSTNCGVEGETDDPAVFAQRRRLQRALLATLFVSQGVPMLQAGDELGRTQRGNNNAYCQDNALAWIDWSSADVGLVDFVSRLADLRGRYPQLRRLDWLSGEADDDGNPDVLWWHPQGRAMHAADWNGSERAFAARLAGTMRGEAALLLLFNPGDARDFVLPDGLWALQLSSADPDERAVVAGGTTRPVAANSLDILAERGDQ